MNTTGKERRMNDETDSEENNEHRNFPITTPKSQLIGRDGHSTDEDWIHFFEKYRPSLLRFLDRHYPRYRFLKDDALSEMTIMILNNPGFSNRKPSVHFRTVLVKLLRKAMANLVRKLREGPAERYAALMGPLQPTETSFDCDRKRLQLLAIDFIRRDLLRDDYQNGRFFREYNSRDLMLWRELNDEGATCQSVARKSGWSVATVSNARREIEEQIARDAEALLRSEGLL